MLCFHDQDQSAEQPYTCKTIRTCSLTVTTLTCLLKEQPLHPSKSLVPAGSRGQERGGRREGSQASAHAHNSASWYHKRAHIVHKRAHASTRPRVLKRARVSIRTRGCRIRMSILHTRVERAEQADVPSAVNKLARALTKLAKRAARVEQTLARTGQASETQNATFQASAECAVELRRASVDHTRIGGAGTLHHSFAREQPSKRWPHQDEPRTEDDQTTQAYHLARSRIFKCDADC